MHDYTTIIGVIELRTDQKSYDTVQKRYRIERSGISLIMIRFKDSGLSLEDLKQMSPRKVVNLIYPQDNFRRLHGNPKANPPLKTMSVSWRSIWLKNSGKKLILHWKP